jgi:hypothetical protein
VTGAPRPSALPPIRYGGDFRYGDALNRLLVSLLVEAPVDQSAPPLERLQIADESDWIVAFCSAWGALSEVISFYQERIVNESFLATARHAASTRRLDHSLGNSIPPLPTATTTLAYQLSAAAAGVEAVQRVSRGGAGSGADRRERQAAAAAGLPPAPAVPPGADAPAQLPGTTNMPPIAPATAPPHGPSGAPITPATHPPAGITTAGAAPTPVGALGRLTQIPPMAQVRAIPGPDGAAPTYVTLHPLTAHVAAGALTVDAQPLTTARTLSHLTTQLELSGTRTGLSVGQPILITGRDPATDDPVSQARVLTSVDADPQRSTRIGWTESLGVAIADPVVYGFAASSALLGSGAASWNSLPPAAQLATPTVEGRPIPTRGGLGASPHPMDAGIDSTAILWSLEAEGLPPATALTALASVGGVTIVATGAAGLFRSAGGAYSPASIGGPRRFVYFVGGSAERMLAGAAGGTVYQSVDAGQTWSVLPTAQPTVEPDPEHWDQQRVMTNQIPPVAVRCVVAASYYLPPPNHEGPWIEHDVLLAGTDNGLYQFAAAKWVRTQLTDPVIDVLVLGAEVRAPWLLCAATTGVWKLISPESAAGWRETEPLRLGSLTRVVKLATLADGSVFAAADSGVWWLTDIEVNAKWIKRSDGLPGGAVSTITGAGTVLLCAPASGGVYRSTDHGESWLRCDRSLAFELPGGALAQDATEGKPPPSLIAAFADFGIVLGDGARLDPAPAGFELTGVGPDTYLLEPGLQDGTLITWSVILETSLPSVSALAVGSSDVLAAGAPRTTLATEWPGMPVAGTAVEIVPPSRKVAPGAPALIEQRTEPALVSQVVDVQAVERASLNRFGRQTLVTRIHFSPEIEPGTFPRRDTTVWTGAAPRPLFVAPDTAAVKLAGTRIPVAQDLNAPVDQGRLVSVTGSPPGLAVAPLGGAWRATRSTVEAAGPAQAAVSSVAVDAAGNVFLATSEGVFEINPSRHVPLLVSAGWPPRAKASAVMVVGSTPFAATEAGLLRCAPALLGAKRAWRAVGPVDEPFVALATHAGVLVAATTAGDVYRCDQPAAPTPAWSALGAPPGGRVTHLAFRDGAAYAATPAGVFARDSTGPWAARGTGFASGGEPTALVVDSSATLWAASAVGLQSLRGGVGEWRPDPAFTQPHTALCIDPAGIAIAATAEGLFRLRADGFDQVAPTPTLAPTAVAAAADETFWLGSTDVLPLEQTISTARLDFGRSPLVAGIVMTGTDVATLDQGGLPDAVLAGFTGADPTLSRTDAVVTGTSSDGYWLVRVDSDLYVLALRYDAGGDMTVNAYANDDVAYPTGPATTSGGMDAWPVEIGDATGTLRAPRGLIQLLPADADAPALAETCKVSSASPAVDGGGAIVELEPPGLVHVYDASTVQLSLNVAAAAQGQPVALPLGSGNPKVAHQAFAIPTPIAAIPDTPGNPTAAPKSSLRILVDGQQWSEVHDLLGAGPDSPVCVVRYNPNGTALVTFGDGLHGSRLPAGRDNVVAVYLQGGGAGGQAGRGAVTQALDRPQLVKAVHNPSAALIPPVASPAQTRVAGVRALDQLVSVDDYETAAAAVAGVASATAELVGSAGGRAVVVTICAAPKAPEDLADTVQETLGDTSASGVPVWVAIAKLVPVDAAIEAVPATEPASQADFGKQLHAAVAGLAAAAPGQPLLAMEVLNAVTRIPNVAAARIVGWNRAGLPHDTAPFLRARGARWAASSPAPQPAELLVLPAAGIEISVLAPLEVGTT